MDTSLMIEKTDRRVVDRLPNAGHFRLVCASSGVLTCSALRQAVSSAQCSTFSSPHSSPMRHPCRATRESRRRISPPVSPPRPGDRALTWLNWLGPWRNWRNVPYEPIRRLCDHRPISLAVGALVCAHRRKKGRAAPAQEHMAPAAAHSRPASKEGQPRPRIYFSSSPTHPTLSST